jgi:hypothetical protein
MTPRTMNGNSASHQWVTQVATRKAFIATIVDSSCG